MLPEKSILQGRYEILRPIGRGGMGAVYKANDMRLRCVVALKETLVNGDAARKAFEREAQLLAGLRHPALPKVSDHFTEDDGQFLVMDFITGDDLATLLAKRGGPFEAAHVVRWVDNLLDALDYLHNHEPPIVHRDIKPQNMKLTDRNEIILLDFGLAKGTTQATRMTSSGSIFGYTPHYAPLEQIQGTGTDPRSDLYALAATMYHLLTNETPPDALTRASARINDEPDPLLPANQLNPAVPPAIAAIIERAMAQKPNLRFRTAREMRDALHTAQTHGTVPLAAAAATILIADDTQVRRTPVPVTVASAGQPALASSGTTQRAAPTRTAGQPSWLLPIIGLSAVTLVAALIIAFTGGRGAPPPQPTLAPIAAVATAAPTLAPFSTMTGEELIATAGALQTATAAARLDQIATARALVNQEDGAATQTAIAQTPTATPVPTYAATAAAPTATRRPTATPRPTSDVSPTTAPTSAPAPTDAPQTPGGAVIRVGSGALFKGSASKGDPIDPGQGAGGSCIQGRVLDVNGQTFETFYVQVDNGGDTRPAKAFYDSGNYRICGLDAGNWGVAVYAYNGIATGGGEQGAHQVIVRASGTPGEIFYVNFKATIAAPTPVPNTATPVPTDAPVASPYDGIWRGTNAGTTTTGDYAGGRFELEVRNGAIYRISIDGPSCFFDTYPNYPDGVAFDGKRFGVNGAVYNPKTGADNNINYAFRGAFASQSSANGTLSVSQNGATCANGTWNASK